MIVYVFATLENICLDFIRVISWNSMFCLLYMSKPLPTQVCQIVEWSARHGHCLLLFAPGRDKRDYVWVTLLAASDNIRLCPEFQILFDGPSIMRGLKWAIWNAAKEICSGPIVTALFRYLARTPNTFFELTLQRILVRSILNSSKMFINGLGKCISSVSIV